MKQRAEETYTSNIKGWSFTWRPLTRREYISLAARRMAGEDIEQDILLLALISPDPSLLNFDQMPAGVIECLVNSIWSRSAPPDTDELMETIDQMRAAMNLFEFQAENVISAAFPHISLEETRDWPYSKLIEYTVRAEWILRNVHGMPLEIGKIQEVSQQKLDPDKLRKNGIDPMTTIQPEEIYATPLPERIIIGIKHWRSYKTTSPQPSPPLQPGSQQSKTPRR